MQFFPPLDVNPGQSSLVNSGFGHAEPRADQDFSGVLSTQMERQDAPDPRPSEPAPDTAREPEGSPAREHDSAGGDDGRRSASGDGVSGSGEAWEEKAPSGDASVERQAKDAGDGQAGVSLSGDADAGDEAAESVAKVSSGPENEQEAAGRSDAAVTEEELREAVAALARRAEGLEEAIPGIAAGVREVQELVRRFRESAPSERGELGKTIAARIKALREEMASARQGDASETMRERAVQGASDSAREAGELPAGAAISRGAATSVRIMTDGDAAADGGARHGGRALAKAARDDSGSESASGQDSAPDAETSPGSVRARGEAAGNEASAVKTQKAASAHASDTAGESGSVQVAGRSDASRAESVNAPGPSGGKAADEVLLARERTEAMPRTEVRERPVGAGTDVEADGSGPETHPGLRERMAQRETRTVHDGVEGSRARDAKAASETASAGLAGRGEVVREKGRDLAPGQVSVADAADESGRSGRTATAADGGESRSRGDARQGFFSPGDDARQALDRTSRTVNATVGKNIPEAQLQGAGAGQDVQQTVQQRLESPVSGRSAEVYRQVENGAFRNLGQGVRQLVIRLDPADLGQISVILQVKGKEVQAVLRASNQETSHALGEQMSQLRAHLESQGLRVSRLEVQTQLADSQQQSQWQGAEQHNRFQENRELALSAQRWRNLGRTEGGLVRDVQPVLHRENLSQDGLDIFA